MLKSLNFIILAFLVVTNTKSMPISVTALTHESYTDASLSLNPAVSPYSIDCLGLTSEECLSKKTKNTQKDCIYPCPWRGCK